MRKKQKIKKTDPVDVLIIGAGASGAAIAYSLTELGVQITCLEQGSWVDTQIIPVLSRTMSCIVILILVVTRMSVNFLKTIP